MTAAAVILGRFVGVMAELAFYLSQMGFMRVWYNFLRPIGKFGLISMTFVADHRGNLIFWGILFMTTSASDASDFVFVC
jgi:hypothetical protein